MEGLKKYRKWKPQKHNGVCEWSVLYQYGLWASGTSGNDI